MLLGWFEGSFQVLGSVKCCRMHVESLLLKRSCISILGKLSGNWVRCRQHLLRACINIWNVYDF